MYSIDHNLPADWVNIQDLAALVEANKLSYRHPVFLFKHSTRCGISSHAKYELQQWSQKKERQLSVYFLDLLSFRHLSNHISESTGVPHQSPQLIALVNGEAVDAISHTSIEENELHRFYNKIFPLAE